MTTGVIAASTPFRTNMGSDESFADLPGVRTSYAQSSLI